MLFEVGDHFVGARSPDWNGLAHMLGSANVRVPLFTSGDGRYAKPGHGLLIAEAVQLRHLGGGRDFYRNLAPVASFANRGFSWLAAYSSQLSFHPCVYQQ